MAITRRDLLVQLIGGVTASAAVPSLNAAMSGAMPRMNGVAGVVRKIYLDRNENAYGASPRIIALLRDSANQANLYPEPTAALREALAKHHGVSGEQIIVGCGSSEVLRMAASAFLGPGKKLVLASPTFDLIETYGAAQKANVVKVPLRKDYAHDLDGMLSRIHGTAGLVYICNPNNPTGSLTERREIEEFLESLPSTAYAIIDEAYHHYAGGSGAYASFLERRVDNPRLIVTRTFSIAYGLAALRVGYAIASKETAGRMTLESLPFGVNRLGLLAAAKAMEDTAHVENCVESNAHDRQEFLNQVNARMLRALNSHTNFVCLKVMRPATEVIEHYRKNNLTLAPAIPEMPTYLRISLGKPEEMREFWRVWDLQGPQSMAM
jgi:histidinol-phosphate aminotransferase